MPFALYMQAANAGYIGLFAIIQRCAGLGICKALFVQLPGKFYFSPAAFGLCAAPAHTGKFSIVFIHACRVVCISPARCNRLLQYRCISS